MAAKAKTREERVAEKMRVSIASNLSDSEGGGRYRDNLLPALKTHLDDVAKALATGHPDDLARVFGPGVEYAFQGNVARFSKFKSVLRNDWSNANKAVADEDAAAEAARLEAEAAKERERLAKEARRADYERLKALEREFGK